MYADYSYYVSVYLGNAIQDTDFPRLSKRASDYIDRVTGGKAAAWVEAHPNNTAVKDCCCALAENYTILESVQVSAMHGELASESVGSHSVSYRSGAEVKASVEAEMVRICKGYLRSTGLLYRGVVCCVHTAHCDVI